MKRRSYLRDLNLVLVAVCTSLGCGDVGGLDQTLISEGDREIVASFEQGLSLPKCTPPSTPVCSPPPPNTGVKLGACFCVKPPSQPRRITLVPDFFITHVVYAPPGRSSSIEYSSSHSLGTTVSVSSSVKSDVSVIAEASGILDLGGLSVTSSRAAGTSLSDEVEVSTEYSQGYEKSGQVDHIDHNYDEIWFLIRPKLELTFLPSTSTEKAKMTWKFGAQDGFAHGVSQYVYAGWLNDAMRMPDSVRDTLAFYGINREHYGTLLAADPLFTGSRPNMLMDRARFEYVGEYPYVPPFEAGDDPSTQTYSVQRKMTSTRSRETELEYSVGISASSGVDLKLFEAKLEVEAQWTWTNSSAWTKTAASETADSFTIGQPAFGYVGPTLLHVYEDKIFKTYAFTLDFPQGVENVALGRPSWQSSDLPGYGAVAARANDGNTDGNFWNGSVTHTDRGIFSGEEGWPGQYWYVDLGATKTIEAVNIFNRTDYCTECLSHYNVLVLDEQQNRWRVIANRSGDDTAGVAFFRWPGNLVKTRYVMVAKTDDNYLHLAEVQVMGF